MWHPQKAVPVVQSAEEVARERREHERRSDAGRAALRKMQSKAREIDADLERARATLLWDAFAC
jgi:Arc/MetJ-type ribon-helix-helix transcriptional regulator